MYTVHSLLPCAAAAAAVRAVPDCCDLQGLEDVLAEAEDDVGGTHGSKLLGASTLRHNKVRSSTVGAVVQDGTA
jgi:hypothetical protein